MSLRGIDVSRHQGTIDWEKVKAWKNSANGETIQFVIIRAGYGRFKNQEDAKFKYNIEQASKNKIPVGIYWYSYATSVKQAEEEARVCLEVIRPYKDKITLPVFFDQEYEPGILALSNSTRTSICLKFIETIVAAGYKSGLYASYDWFMNKIDRNKLKDYPAWVAQYASKCSYTGSNLYIWQSSSKGKVDGISGNVDMDTGYFTLEVQSPTWKQDDVGWWYEMADGTYPKSKWMFINGMWYYFNDKGYAVTDWYKVDDEWYYFITKEDSEKTGYKECACMEIVDDDQL